MKKSVELAEPSTILETASTARWLQIIAPFALSVFVGAMLGAMLGALAYGSSIDPSYGDGKFLVAQFIGIGAGLVVGIIWSRSVAEAGAPEDSVNIGMSMLRKYKPNHAKNGVDEDAAQYKISAEYLRSIDRLN